MSPLPPRAPSTFDDDHRRRRHAHPTIRHHHPGLHRRARAHRGVAQARILDRDRRRANPRRSRRERLGREIQNLARRAQGAAPEIRQAREQERKVYVSRRG